MKLIIHDLPKEDFTSLFSLPSEDIRIITNNSDIHNCIGCFGCWIKTPGKCTIRDNYGDMGEYLSQSDEMIIVSNCVYGGFSPFVKNILDRCISYVHPYFIFKNGEMHHRRRYNKQLNLRILFYGTDLTKEEKSTAQELVKANAINLHCDIYKISFYDEISEMKGVELCKSHL